MATTQQILTAEEHGEFLNRAQLGLREVSTAMAKAHAEAAEIRQRVQDIQQKLVVRIEKMHGEAVLARREFRQCVDALRAVAKAAAASLQTSAQTVVQQLSEASASAHSFLEQALGAQQAISARIAQQSQHVVAEMSAREADVSRHGAALKELFEGMKTEAARHFEAVDQEVLRVATSFGGRSHELIEAYVVAPDAEFSRRSGEAVAALRKTLSDGAATFSLSVGGAMDRLRTTQFEEAAQLRQAIDDTRRAIEVVTVAFENLSATFARVSRSVGSTMEKTQVGLKVTAGTFQNVREVLASVT